MMETPVTVTIPSLPALVMWLTGGLAAHMGLTAWVVDAVLERKWMKLFETCSDRVEPRVRLMLNREIAMLQQHESQLAVFSSEMRTGLATHAAALQSGLSPLASALDRLTLAMEKMEERHAAGMDQLNTKNDRVTAAVARIEGRLMLDRRGGSSRHDDLHRDE